MRPTTRRRIVRGAVMALAVVVLLVSGYVGSHGCACWLHGRGAISDTQQLTLNRTVFAPVGDPDIPGGILAYKVGEWCYWRGSGKAKAWEDLGYPIDYSE